MGWFDESHPGHEGYLAGFVEHEECGRGFGIFRELGYPGDDGTRLDVVALSAACECGWRSPRFKPERGGAQWSPFVVSATDKDEDKARALWREHLST